MSARDLSVRYLKDYKTFPSCPHFFHKRKWEEYKVFCWHFFSQRAFHFICFSILPLTAFHTNNFVFYFRDIKISQFLDREHGWSKAISHINFSVLCVIYIFAVYSLKQIYFSAPTKYDVRHKVQNLEIEVIKFLCAEIAKSRK